MQLTAGYCSILIEFVIRAFSLLFWRLRLWPAARLLSLGTTTRAATGERQALPREGEEEEDRTNLQTRLEQRRLPSLERRNVVQCLLAIGLPQHAFDALECHLDLVALPGRQLLNVHRLGLGKLLLEFVCAKRTGRLRRWAPNTPANSVRCSPCT
jgi:hypothetical protein